MSISLLIKGAVVIIPCMLLARCNAKVAAEPRFEEMPPADVEHKIGFNLVEVDHPEQFPVTQAAVHEAVSELNVTGTVTADVSQNVPVVSLASGRLVEIHARLGDEVIKGQLLMRIQSADLSSAFSDYRKASTDESLAQVQLDRAKLLYSKGVVARKELEVAQDINDKSKVDVEAAEERLRVLGADLRHPSAVVDIFAPISGVITEQNVTVASGIKSLDNSPNLFTIADLSRIWIVCDVYENDLPEVHLNELADVRLNAYPNRMFQGRISNIGPILDANTRTAKVRVEVENPGLMKLGMFVRTTFHGRKQLRAVVPSAAVLHLHDRDWVYIPQSGRAFRRVEVISGRMVTPARQEIISGIRPGELVVSNALDLQNTADR